MGDNDRAWSKCQAEVSALRKCNQEAARRPAPVPARSTDDE